MFDNIGGKIKGLAVVSTVIGFAASVITGMIITFSYGDFEGFMLGVGVMFAGFLFFWISSLTLYGLGQLIENTTKSVRRGENPTGYFFSALYADVISLYRLDQVRSSTQSEDLGPLPQAAVALIAVLLTCWVGMGIYVGAQKLRKKKSEKAAGKD